MRQLFAISAVLFFLPTLVIAQPLQFEESDYSYDAFSDDEEETYEGHTCSSGTNCKCSEVTNNLAFVGLDSDGSYMLDQSLPELEMPDGSSMKTYTCGGTCANSNKVCNGAVNGHDTVLCRCRKKKKAIETLVDIYIEALLDAGFTTEQVLSEVESALE